MCELTAAMQSSAVEPQVLSPGWCTGNYKTEHSMPRRAPVSVYVLNNKRSMTKDTAL
jgi:hypothetical protein